MAKSIGSFSSFGEDLLQDIISRLNKSLEGPPPKDAMAKSIGSFSSIGEDLLQDILSRLPAVSFASAACVNCSWNYVCNQILTPPKLLSALSLNPSFEVAVTEVLNKVLAEPIRPHFAIAWIGKRFNAERAHQFLVARLGSRIPIIVSSPQGIIGGDALTDEFKEVKWIKGAYDEAYNSKENVHRGIALTVGFVPGLKVSAIPLVQPLFGPPDMSMVDNFVTDIREFTNSVSGCTSPVGIIMFGGERGNLKPALDKLNYAMPRETVIVGEERGCFLYSNGVDSTVFGRYRNDNSKNPNQQTGENVAVCLVFASDATNPCAAGEIQFSLAVSTGLSVLGPTYKAASVRVTRGEEPESSTWLTARREESLDVLDGQTILHDIENLIENGTYSDDLYIGVTKRRKCSIGSEKKKSVSSLAFHEVAGGDEEYLFVGGDGIKTGDCFRFFRPDPETALKTHNDVVNELRDMKQGNGDEKKVFGGLIFCCYGRGEPFFPRANVDSSAFLDNFKGVPLAGMHCCGEIGRGGSFDSIREEDINGQSSRGDPFLHVYSAIYLLMSFTPKPVEF